MRAIFEEIKKGYEKDKDKEIKFDYDDGIPIEEKLQYIILKQRYDNLGEFLKKQEKYYEGIDVNEMQNLLFFYNDLKEVNFIGTDLFANAMFIKNSVPYLYRSIGKDEKKEKKLVQYKNHVSEIFTECLNQIETGVKGELFSYTKCFGKMLYKYITLQPGENETSIEIRKNANVNSIYANVNSIYHDKPVMSIQQYARKCADNNEEKALPYFSVDMSNARDNKVEHLKEWVIAFFGERDWHWYKDIVDPIGDAEVVCNLLLSTLFDEGKVRLNGEGKAT